MIITEKRVEQLRERIARRINRHGLTVPALMYLQMHKPLAGVGGALIHIIAPGLDWLLGEQDTEALAALIGDRQEVEGLIARVEELDTKREKEVKNQC